MTPSKRSVTLGPIGEIVRRELANWRRALNLTAQELSDRIGQGPRPLGRSAISEIERGDRRVDVDDLVALSFGLEVSPTRLLVPMEEVPVIVGTLGAVPWVAYANWVRQAVPLDAETFEISNRLTELRTEVLSLEDRAEAHREQAGQLGLRSAQLHAAGEVEESELARNMADEAQALAGDYDRARQSLLEQIERAESALRSIHGDY